MLQVRSRSSAGAARTRAACALSTAAAAPCTCTAAPTAPRAGSQVYLCYGRYTNLSMLELYGFLLDTNPHDQALLPLEVVQAAMDGAGAADGGRAGVGWEPWCRCLHQLQLQPRRWRQHQAGCVDRVWCLRGWRTA